MDQSSRSGFARASDGNRGVNRSLGTRQIEPGDQNVIYADTGREGKNSSKRHKSRKSVACNSCKIKKTECDRGLPNCGPCSRNEFRCEYNWRKKRGRCAGYKKGLECKSDALGGFRRQQDKPVQLQPSRTSNPSVTSTVVYAPSECPLACIPSAIHPQIPLAERNTSLPYSTNVSIPQKAWTHLYDEGTISAVADRLDITRSPCLGSIVGQGLLSHPREHTYSPILSKSPLAFPALSMDGQAAHQIDLPPSDLVYALTDLYFKYVNPCCPILHQDSTLECLLEIGALEEPEKVLLHAIVATTMRFSNDSRLTPVNRDHYYKSSRRIVMLYGLENTSVRALQALVILALDIIGTSHGPQGWNILAVATRCAIQLGLTVEPFKSSMDPCDTSILTHHTATPRKTRDWIGDESCRRLFWMTYFLDRYAAIATTLGFGLHDQEIGRRLPCHEIFFVENRVVTTPYFSMGASNVNTSLPLNHRSIGVLSYYVGVYGILGRIHTFLQKPVNIGVSDDVERWLGEHEQLDSWLTDFYTSLSEEFAAMLEGLGSERACNNSDSLWLNLFVTYHMAIIRLHSPAAYPTNISHLVHPSDAASQRCLNAAENIAILCERITAPLDSPSWTKPSITSFSSTPDTVSRLGPTFALSIWTAARLLLTHGYIIGHLDPSIFVMISTLHHLGSYWSVASGYAISLMEDLERDWASDKPRSEQCVPRV